MASIKGINTRKFKITVSNGYRPDGRKISKAKTLFVSDTVHSRSISQYVAHEAEEFERIIKTGYCEDSEMTFQEYASRWLERQTKYAPSTLGFYRRSLETVYPYIGNIKLSRLRPITLENLLIELRKRTFRGKTIQETTVQKYLTVVSAVLSDAKKNEIIQKDPARMIDLPDTTSKIQAIPSDEEAAEFLNIIADIEDPYKTFYALAIYTGCRRGELCALKWSGFLVDGYEGVLTVSRSRSMVPGKGIMEGPTKNGKPRTIYMSEDMMNLVRSYCYQKRDEALKGDSHSVIICSRMSTESRCIRTPSQNICGGSTMKTDSPESIISTLCDTISSPLCSTMAWTSRRWPNWPVTEIPAFWSEPTATHRCSSSREQLTSSLRTYSLVAVVPIPPPLDCCFRRIFADQKGISSFPEIVGVCCACQISLNRIEVNRKGVKYYGKHQKTWRQLPSGGLHGLRPQWQAPSRQTENCEATGGPYTQAKREVAQ